MKSIANILAISTMILLSACASTPPNPALGIWSFTIDGPTGTMPGSLNLASDGTGSALIEMPVSGGGQTRTSLNNIAYDSENVSFSANLYVGGNPITFNFTGTVEGDSINGKVNSELGSMVLKGVRQ